MGRTGTLTTVNQPRQAKPSHTHTFADAHAPFMSGTSTGVAAESEVAYPPRVRRRKSPLPAAAARCCRGGWAREEEGAEAAAATAASCASTAVCICVYVCGRGVGRWVDGAAATGGGGVEDIIHMHFLRTNGQELHDVVSRWELAPAGYAHARRGFSL